MKHVFRCAMLLVATFFSIHAFGADYTLTIDANGGTNHANGGTNGGPDKYTFNGGTGHTIPIPTRPGHTLTSLDGAGAITTSAQKVGAAYLSNYQGFKGSSPEILSFNGTSTYYDLGKAYYYTDELTVNVWAYMDDWKGFAGGKKSIISCNQNGGWSIKARGKQSLGFNFTVYDNVKVLDDNDEPTANYTERRVRTTASKYNLDEFASGWHMFTIVVKNKKLSAYIDGELIADNTDSDTDFTSTIHYNSQSHIILGADAHRVRENNTTDSYVESDTYFAGKICNVAIMHIALSTANIESLYKNPGGVIYKTPTANKTIKAVWKAVTQSSKTLTIDTNGGTNTMTAGSFTQKEGSSVTITNPLHTHSLASWGGNTEGRKYISNFQGFPGSSPEVLDFNGKTFKNIGRDYMFNDKFTVNLWAYMSNWEEFESMKLISCTESGGWDITSVDADGDNNQFVGFSVWDKGWGNYTRAKTSNNYKITGSGWHMFTLVFDGTCIRGYVDGQSVATSRNLQNGKTDPTKLMGCEVVYHPTNDILLGAESGGAANKATAGYYFKGKMRNVAIMHTALSDADITTLYNNPGITQYYFPAANKTLKATWEAPATSTLTVNEDNGTATETIENTENSVQIIDNPVKESHTFVSWNGDAAGAKYLSNYQGYTSSTPTGKRFNGTTDFEVLGKEYMFEDKITVNVWAYMDDWSNFKSVRMISCAQGGGWDIEPYNPDSCFAFLLHHPNPWKDKDQNNYMRAHSNHEARYNKSGQTDAFATTLSTGKRVYYGEAAEVTDDDIVLGNKTWHMFTMTFDGQTLLGYIDGELVAKQVAPSVGKINYYGYTKNTEVGNKNNFSNGIFIGAEAGTSATTPDEGYYFPGKMANVAIMHAAIPADEVKALYANFGTTRYYYPSSNKTIKALWETAPTPTMATLTINTNGSESSMAQTSYTQAVGTKIRVTQPVDSIRTFLHWAENTQRDDAITATSPTRRFITNVQRLEGEKVTVANGVVVSRGPKQALFSNSSDVLEFNEDTYYDLGREYMYSEALTVNVWAYMDNWSEYEGKRIISCTDAGGWSIEPNSSDTKHIVFKGRDYGIGYRDAINTGFSYATLEKGWHMFTITFDGKNLRGYVDGELIATSVPYLSGVIGYYDHTNNRILLGAESQYNKDNYFTPSTLFKGKIRNLTIMEAAMPAADVKELYLHPNATFAYLPKSHTLKAEWQEHTDNTAVTIQPNGGVNTMENDTYTQKAGSSLVITKQPIKFGSEFWYWEETDANGVKYHSTNTHSGIRGKKITVTGELGKYTVASVGEEEVLFNDDEIIDFDGSTYYDLGPGYKYPDCFTVNVWAWMENWKDFSIIEKPFRRMRMFSATNAGGYNIEDDHAGHIRFLGYDSGARTRDENEQPTHHFNGEYSTATSTVSWESLGTNNWRMFTYVYDGSYVRGYLDGQLIATSDKYFGPMKFANNHFLLGAEAGGGDYTTSETLNNAHHLFFKGKLKRLSIIHAALTPEQIDDLHKHSSTTRHYFHSAQPELKAVWRKRVFYVEDWAKELILLDIDENQTGKDTGSNIRVSITDASGNAIVSQTLTKNNLGYYPVTIALADRAGEILTFTFTNTTTSTTVTDKIEVPFIIETEEDKTRFEGTTEEYNLVVKNDIVQPKARTSISDLVIDSDTKHAITADEEISASAVYFISEGDKVPHLVIPYGGQINLQNPVAYFIKRIPGDRFYFFSLPFDCEISTINYWDGSAVRGYYNDWEVYEYDGETRAADHNSYGFYWKVVEDTKLYAGRGYIVGVDAPAGETRDLIFPMKLESTALHDLENAEKKVELRAHGVNAAIANNHKGWNLIGNPYFTSYGTGAVEGVLKSGTVKDNKWIEDNNFYINFPNESDGGKTYDQKLYTETDLSPFSAFFVQAGSDDDFTYAPTAEPINPTLAPRKQASAQTTKRTYAGVYLSNGSDQDETSLVIGEQFTQAYEIGSDLEKMLGLGERPQVYVHDAAYEYAFKSLSQADAAKENSLGVYLPTAGEYTFAIKDSYDISRLQAVYLTDKETGITLNLKQTPYTFTVDGKKHTTDRFSISAILAANIATELTETVAAWAVWQNAPSQIHLQGLTVGEEVRIFSSTGMMIYQGIISDTSMTLTLPAAGTYCVQTIGSTGTYLKKIMVTL